MRRMLLGLLLLAACGGCEPPGAEVSPLLGGTLGGGPFTDPPPSEAEPIGIDLETPWEMHVITAGAVGAGQPDGADGIQGADVDGDGLVDVVTGHEQGLRATLAFNPGAAGHLVRQPWPTVTLPGTGGNLCSAEDAVFGDLDGDGALDVVTACELGTVRVTVIYGPAPPNSRNELMNPTNWTRVDIAASAGNRAMRAQVIDIAGDSAPEIVVGGKESDGPAVAAALGYYSSPTPRNPASWTFTSIAPVGWVMQLYVLDFDGDADLDIVYSDRDPINVPSLDNSRRGVRWMESNGADPPSFTAHTISPVEGVHKWFDLRDWDGDGDLDVADCRSDDTASTSRIYLNGGGGLSWTTLPVAQPSGTGQAQHAVFVDVDMDGLDDLAYSYSNSQSLTSAAWLKRSGPSLSPTFERGEISGILSAISDVKMDNQFWHDFDGDGDLDLGLTEQHVDLPSEPPDQPKGDGPGIGDLWFENPLIDAPFIEPPPTVSCALLTSGSTSTDGTSAQTASISPTAGRALYASVVSCNASGPVTATTSGNGLSWALEGTVAYAASNARRVTVRRGAGSPTPGVVTFDYGVQVQTCFAWSVVECDGADLDAPTAQVVTATTAAATATTIHAALAPLAAPTSRILAFVGTNVNSLSIAPDPEFLELSEATVANGNATLESQTAVGETSVDPTFNIASAGTVVVEVRPAP